MEHSGMVSRSNALYERYGNNEPYTEPEDKSCYRGPKEYPEMFFKLITGPSTNFYVGPEREHYTLPKRLIYHFSEYAKACLEGPFSEAAANAIWLPDIDPDLFQFLWRWLYTGELGILGIHGYWSRHDWRVASDGQQRHRQRECQLLCRVHMLGERLLFDRRFLVDVVHGNWTLQEVLSGSTPVEHWTLADDSLRPFVLHHWCDFDLCTTIDYYDYAECFELDGAFAAEMMAYMAYELQWAVGRWEKQTQTAVEVNAKKKQLAEEDGLDQSMERIYGKREGAWLACRYMCTFTGCTTTDFRAYSQCFELDGTFPAHIMEYMAEELLWVVDRWGVERGRSVDFSAEKQVEEDEDAFQRMVDRAIQRAELRR